MNAPQRPSVNDMTDLIVPAALRIGLVFLLAFWLLGYSVSFSILFAALGGVAGGVVAAWWQAYGGEPLPSETTTVQAPAAAPKSTGFFWQRGRQGSRRRRSR